MMISCCREIRLLSWARWEEIIYFFSILLNLSCILIIVSFAIVEFVKLYLYSPNTVAVYVIKRINKQTEKGKDRPTSQKETIACNMHIAYCSHNHLGLCHKHFAIVLKITIFRIKAGFAVLYSFVVFVHFVIGFCGVSWAVTQWRSVLE